MSDLMNPKEDNPERSTLTYVSNIDVKALDMLPDFIVAKFVNILNEKQPLNVARYSHSHPLMYTRIARYIGSKATTISPTGTPQMSMKTFSGFFTDAYHVKHTTAFPDITDSLSELGKEISSSELEATLLMICIDSLKRPLSIDVAKLISAIILHEQIKVLFLPFYCKQKALIQQGLDKYLLDDLKKIAISKLESINKLSVRNDMWMLESYAMSMQVLYQLNVYESRIRVTEVKWKIE